MSTSRIRATRLRDVAVPEPEEVKAELELAAKQEQLKEALEETRR